MEAIIFISHRHADKNIAKVINNHLQDWGIPPNNIYQSSSAIGGGPRVGDPLAQDLKEALYRANAVILIYTFTDQDWSYCMYECGIATDPQSPNTRIVVFQTTNDRPKVFKDQILVTITENDILRFTTQFHKHEGFIPNQPALAPQIAEEIIKQRSKRLYNNLYDAIPHRSAEERYRWDFFTLRLDSESLTKINHQQSQDIKIKIIQEESEVIKHFGQALEHFGFDRYATNLKLNSLISQWNKITSKRTNIPKTWIQGLCEEMLRAIESIPAEPTWELMKSNVYPDWWFYPIVNHVKINPDESIQFQIYMYRVPGTLPENPDSIKVR